jgi:hypothetical protein
MPPSEIEPSMAALRKIPGQTASRKASDLEQKGSPVTAKRTALEQCRAALARGHLLRDGNHWRFGRRRYSNATVRRLIDEGVAVRDGSIVRSAMTAVSRQRQKHSVG